MTNTRLNTTKIHVPWSQIVVLGMLFLSLALSAPAQTLAMAAQPLNTSNTFKPAEVAQSRRLAGLPGGFAAPDGGNLSGAFGLPTILKPDATISEKATLLLGGEENLSSSVIDPAGGFAYFGTNTDPGMIVKVRLSDFTRVGSLTLKAGETNLTSAVIDTTNGFAYFGANTVPGIVVKVRLSDFSRVDAKPLNAGENNLTSAVIDPAKGFAYFGTNTAPGIVVKVNVNPASFARVAAVTLSTGSVNPPLAPSEDNLTAAVIDTAKGFAYFGTSTSPAIVVKVNVSTATFARVAAVTLDDGQGANYAENNLTAAVIDPAQNFAYFGADNSTGIVVRIDISANNFSRSNQLVLGSGTGKIQSALIDPANKSAYFGSKVDGLHPWVVKVDLLSFTMVSTPIELQSSDNLWTAVIDTAKGLAYFGASGSTPGSVFKVNVSPATFALVESLLLDHAAFNFWAAVIDPAAGFAYFGSYAQPGVIAKVRLSDFSRVATLPLQPGVDGIRSAVIDPTKGFAYFGASNGVVTQVRLSDFTLISSVTAPGGDGLTSAVIDPTNGFAYFGTNSAPGKVVKVHLAPFELITTTVTLLPAAPGDLYGEDNLTSAVIDTANGFAYFGANTTPGKVVKVNVKPTSFARLDSASIPDVGENLNFFTSAVIDPAKGLAYFGTNTTPGKVVTIDVNPNNPFAKKSSTALSVARLASAVIDPAAGFAYFGSQEAPGSVVKVNLTIPASEVEKLPLQANENYLTSAVIDAVKGCAYFGAGDDTAGDFSNNYNPPFESRRIMKIQVGACKDGTTTAIVSHNPSPSNVGQAINVAYLVAAPAGSALPTGNVTVSDGSASCTASVAAGACTLTPTTAGIKTLTATYPGDTTYSGSSGAVAHTVVGKSDSTTTISSHTPDPSMLGQAIAVLYSVTGPGGAPTGVVTVTDGTQSCSALVGDGACMLTLTTAGVKTLTATYSGDADFNGSSGTASHTVNNPGSTATTTTITSHNPNPSSVGQPVVVNFSVTSPGGAPTSGFVFVTDGAASCSVAVTLSNSCTLTPTSAGVKTLTATYTGGSNFNGSSGTASHTVTARQASCFKIFIPLNGKAIK